MLTALISFLISHNIHVDLLISLHKAAEERRKNPPRKIVTILYNKDKRLYSTYPHAPKLLLDQSQDDVLSHYAVVFQGELFCVIAVTFQWPPFHQLNPMQHFCLSDTVVIRVSDLQLSDEGV